MRFYTRQHQHYCGIDLHARTMYVCILDAAGNVLVHKDMAAGPEAFLKAIAPYREDLVVAVECIFTWYWPLTRDRLLRSGPYDTGYGPSTNSRS
jgi:hypothetical protein